MRQLDSITDLMDMNLSKLQEIGKPGVLQSVGSQRHNLATDQKQQQQHLLSIHFVLFF